MAMYSPIADYGIIGDTQSAALINSKGSIDWWCAPHFDSPAIFLRLLDGVQGGCCSIEAEGLRPVRRRYLERTAILETTVATPSGGIRIRDFMPVQKRPDRRSAGQGTITDHRIIRLFQCVEGSADFNFVIRPTFRFATRKAEITRGSDESVLCTAGEDRLHIACTARLDVHQQEQVSGHIHLENGETAALALTYLTSERHATGISAGEMSRSLEQTREYWEAWCGKCADSGDHADIVMRSAITLKLLTFEPTGSILAAPTTSLPEEIGGVRNWDYRFTWLRDATFTLVALMNLGYYEEAGDFMLFLKGICDRSAGRFQILYGIRGEEEQAEEVLDHLEGYRGSRPVRVGNAAAGQKQLDIYGEILDSAYLYASRGIAGPSRSRFAAEMWTTIRDLADLAFEQWRDPDSGIWEVRSGESHFVHSKALCWVALDRASKLALMMKKGREAADWKAEADVVFSDLLSNGFDPQVGAFVQSYGSKALDASILRLPLLGVIDCKDPRMRSTIRQIEKRLMRNGLVYRYVDVDDGLPGGEGTFAICSFWLVQNYVLQERLREAEELFAHLLSFANDLGLFAEEIDPATGEQLGNFPQAFTHIAVINSAVPLAAAKQGKKPDAQRAVGDVA